MLKPLSLGLAFGVLWGATLALCIVLTKFTGYPGSGFYTPIAAIYFGLEVSWLGALLAAIYGFVDGFIGGALFGWLYNFFAKE
ncbi:hypothetical protein KAI54_01145 [Candidatus Gracilibacteria bacterium]|nr:hypothetical protein [Candidatus Gracilibacteria bacterium]